MYTLIQRAALVMTSLAVLNLAGCASPASHESMTPQNLTISKKHPSSVSVETKGGSETGAMDSSNISNAAFKAAIESSIVKSSLFKNVLQGKNGDYELTVSVTDMSKPLFGASFTVEMETAWSLVKKSDNSIAMRKVIKTAHTATMSDAFVGVTRLQLAVEGAARANIVQGLKAISDLDL
jgi:hypothetical protein